MTTVHSIKKTYLEGMREKRAAEDDGNATVLPLKKRGRPVLLGEDLDSNVQLYLKKVTEGGGWFLQELQWLLPGAFCCPVTGRSWLSLRAM